MTTLKTYGITHELSVKTFDEMFPIFENIYRQDLINEIIWKANGKPVGEIQIQVFDDFVSDEQTGEAWPIKRIICSCQFEQK